MNAASEHKLVKEMAKATGVSEGDVAKVLEHLGLSRVYQDAVRSNNGQEPSASQTKVAFKIGKSTIIV